MNLADGAIMFIACVVSFALGYAIGAIRVTRYVNKRLADIIGIMQPIQKASRELSQYYSKLGENEKQ